MLWAGHWAPPQVKLKTDNFTLNLNKVKLGIFARLSKNSNVSIGTDTDQGYIMK